MIETVLIQQAISLRKEGNFEEGVEVLKRLLASKPNSQRAIELLGTLYGQMMEVEKMNEYYRRLVTRKPRFEKKAGEQLRRLVAMRRFREALKRSFEFHRRWPDCWKILCWAGEALICLSQRRQGFARFNKALGLCKGVLRAEVLAWQGEMRLWTGDYGRAVIDFNEAKSHGSRFATCWLGAAKYKIGDVPGALRELDHAVALPGDWEAFVWRGEVERVAGQQSKAFNDLNLAIERNRALYAYFNRALLYADLRDETKMRDDFGHIPIMLVKYLKGYSGMKDSAVLSVGQMREILETGLCLSLGSRRNEDYVLSVWMRSAD